VDEDRISIKEAGMKMNIKAFGLTCGLIWGFGVFFMTWWVMYFEGTTHDPMVLGHFYLGYDISPLGSVIGGAWGLVDGGFGGAFFAWLYNRLAGR
jgi:hypothetical protein